MFQLVGRGCFRHARDLVRTTGQRNRIFLCVPSPIERNRSAVGIALVDKPATDVPGANPLHGCMTATLANKPGGLVVEISLRRITRSHSASMDVTEEVPVIGS